MKYHLLIFWFLLINSALYSQERKFSYIQFDVAVSITGNPDRDEPEAYAGEKKPLRVI